MREKNQLVSIKTRNEHKTRKEKSQSEQEVATSSIKY